MTGEVIKMIDYKKAEQARKLLDESGVDYVLAYLNEGGCAAGQVQGAVLNVACRLHCSCNKDSGRVDS